MAKRQVNLRFLSWIGVLSILPMGLSILNHDTISGILLICLSILLIPSIFDRFNFKFAQKTFNRRLVKLGIFSMGFVMTLVISGINDLRNESKVTNIKSRFKELTEQENHHIYSEIELLKVDINNLPHRYKSRFDTVLKDIQTYQSLIPNKDSLSYSSIPYLNRFSPKEVDSLSSGVKLQFTFDQKLNSLVNKALAESILLEDDFSSKEDYFNYRFIHAKNSNDPEIAMSYFEKIISLNKDYPFTSEDINYAINNYLKFDGYDRLLIRYVKNNMASDVEVQLNLARGLFIQKKFKSAYSLVSSTIMKNDDNIEAIKLAGHIAYARKHKKTAKRHFEKLNELNALDLKSCKILRELTKYISHWNYYSICCDGSRSGSTGRGTCSHHGGVCRTMKEPVYRYKYSYCK
jgi:tetratricopeptide (TPR) repeat protein